MGLITDHHAQPGPEYWNHLCRVCGEDVADHKPAWFERPIFAVPLFMAFFGSVMLFCSLFLR